MEVAHAGLDPGQQDVLERVCRRRGADLLPLPEARRPDVVVLGPGLEEPIRTAQGVGKGQQDATFLLVCEPGRLAAMRQAVRVTPFLGAAVQCVSAEDEELPTQMARSLESAVRRRRAQPFVAFAQASLGTRAASSAGHVLDRLLDVAPVGIVLLDAEGRVLAWNQAASRITGTSERAAIGAGLAHALRAIDPAQVQRALEGGGEAVEVAAPQRHRFVELSATRVPLDHDEGLLIVVQDVSERVRTQRELQDAVRGMERRVEERTRELTALVAHLRDEVEQRRSVEARLEEAQRLARLGSWHMDAPSGTIGLSEPLRQLLALPQAALPLGDFLRHVHPDDRPAVSMAFDRLLREGRPLRLEAGFVRTDGEMRWLELRGRPFDNGGGRGRSAGGTALDVTERRRLEEERVTAIERLKEIERLREVDRFKSQFMNTVAHELFTPLTPIQIQLHVLRERVGERSPQEARSLEIVSRNFARLKSLVSDVLDAVRAQAGHLAIRPQDVDVRRLVAQTVETFASVAQEQGVVLEHDARQACLAHVDPERVSQVLYNLLSNAIKFTGRGGRVRVVLATTKEGCRVRVEDTGIGMTPQQMERLFRPFSQVHEAGAATGGTGLGLYITREIVELHGGRIEVRSDGPGRGSTFEVLLPRHAGAAAEAPAHDAAQDATPPRSS